jgi:hypothetical protein
MSSLAVFLVRPQAEAQIGAVLCKSAASNFFPASMRGELYSDSKAKSTICLYGTI